MTHVLIDRSTLEQIVGALEAVLDDSKYANELTVTGGVYEGVQCKEAITAGRAALANAEPAGWKPIETAPKGSKSKIVWCPTRKNTFIATWRAGDWYVFGAHDVMLSESPTHWMPLPAAPGDTL